MQEAAGKFPKVESLCVQSHRTEIPPAGWQACRSGNRGGGARVCERAHGGPPDGHFGAHVQQHVGAGGSAGGVSGRRVVKEERYKERKGEDESGAQSRSGSN